MKRDLVIEWKYIGTDVTSTCERRHLAGGEVLDVLEEFQPVSDKRTSLHDSGENGSKQYTRSAEKVYIVVVESGDESCGCGCERRMKYK